MIYLYGLSDAPPSVLDECLAGQQGLEGPVKRAPVDNWQLVYSDHQTEEVLPKRRLMLTHTRILERMLPFGAVLPARFGLIAHDVETARRLILDQSDPVAASFARVAGCIELGLRIRFDRQCALEATIAADPELRQAREALAKGQQNDPFKIAAFGEKLADRLDRRRGEAQRQLLNALTPLARDHVLRAPDADMEVLRAEFLLFAEDRESFVAAASQIAEALDFAPKTEPQIEAIGPAPMYHFVQLNLSANPKEQAA